MAGSVGFRSFEDKEKEEHFSAGSARGGIFIPDTLPVFVPKEGKNVIRLLPPRADDTGPAIKAYGIDVCQYFVRGKGSFLSADTFDASMRDPLFEKFQELRMTDESKAEYFRGNGRKVIQLLSFNEDKNNGVVMVWSAPKMFIDEINKIARDPRTGELLPVTDPEEGRIITFVREGTGMKSKYSGYVVHPDKFGVDQSISEEMYLFQDLVNVPTVEESEQIVEDIMRALNNVPDSPSTTQQAPAESTPAPAADTGHGVTRTSRTAPMPEQPAEPAQEATAAPAEPPAEAESPEEAAARIRSKLEAARTASSAG